MPRLLILACSARKRLDRSALPAIERYDGVNFRILKKTSTQTEFPTRFERAYSIFINLGKVYLNALAEPTTASKQSINTSDKLKQ